MRPEMTYNLEKKERIWHTTYKLDDRCYAGIIVANSIEDAKSIAYKRNIGEQIEGCSAPKDLKEFMSIKTFKDLLHYTCYLSWVSIKSGSLTVDEVLSDHGILHELIHYNHHGTERSFQYLADRISQLTESTALIPIDSSIIHRILSAGE